MLIVAAWTEDSSAAVGRVTFQPNFDAAGCPSSHPHPRPPLPPHKRKVRRRAHMRGLRYFTQTRALRPSLKGRDTKRRNFYCRYDPRAHVHVRVRAVGVCLPNRSCDRLARALGRALHDMVCHCNVRVSSIDVVLTKVT